PANKFVLVLGDSQPDPTLPPGENSNTIRDPTNTNTPNYLTANPHVLSFSPEQKNRQLHAARHYYWFVRTSPDGRGPSIARALPTLDAFVKRYFGPFERNHPFNLPEQVATYFNKGDLGIGREMHCILRAYAGELACYVKNFAGKAKDDKAKFDDFD